MHAHEIKIISPNCIRSKLQSHGPDPVMTHHSGAALLPLPSPPFMMPMYVVIPSYLCMDKFKLLKSAYLTNIVYPLPCVQPTGKALCHSYQQQRASLMVSQVISQPYSFQVHLSHRRTLAYMGQLCRLAQYHHLWLL